MVLVALPGFLGKPRPAVVVQSDSLRESGTILVYPITSAVETAADLRPDLQPSPETGLRQPSRIMVDKVTVIQRETCRGPIGSLSGRETAALNGSLAFVLGLADA